MGQCISSKNKKIRPSQTRDSLTEKLISTRDTILDLIQSLHILRLSCSKGIETSIIENNRDLAITLRLKSIFLEEKCSKFRDLISKIDESLKPETESKKLKEILKQSELFLQSLNVILTANDVQKLLDKNDDYYILVVQELKSQNLNQTEAEKYIDKEIEARSSSPSRKFRRKYSRRGTTL